MINTAPDDIRIARCTPERFADALALLRGAGLPIDDVTPEAVELYVAITPEGEIVGCGGLERHGDAALLRSLAVEQGHRGAWIGALIAKRVLEEARLSGIRDALVLTAALRPSLVWRFGFHPARRKPFDDRMIDSRGWQLSRGSQAKLYHCDLTTAPAEL